MTKLGKRLRVLNHWIFGYILGLCVAAAVLVLEAYGWNEHVLDVLLVLMAGFGALAVVLVWVALRPGRRHPRRDLRAAAKTAAVGSAALVAVAFVHLAEKWGGA